MEEQNKTPLTTLDDRIKAARADYAENATPHEEEHGDSTSDENEKRSTRAGSEMLASIFAGGLIGYGIDWLFSIAPWGLLSFMILGFVSGVYRANATVNETDEHSDDDALSNKIRKD